MSVAKWKCDDCGGEGYHFKLCPAWQRVWEDPRDAEITALRVALDQERAKVRALAESPPMASISLCCGIVRHGWWPEPTMHDGGCCGRHVGELGKTYYLHDVSALLSGRAERGSDG